MKNIPTPQNEKKARKALDAFLKHLKREGFNEGIRQYLNIYWKQDVILFEVFKERLKSLKFKVGEFELEDYDHLFKMYRYKGTLNEQEVTLMVQPLQEELQPYDHGFYGIIPAKMSAFFPVTKKEFKDVSEEADSEEHESQGTGEIMEEVPNNEELIADKDVQESND